MLSGTTSSTESAASVLTMRSIALPTRLALLLCLHNVGSTSIGSDAAVFAKGGSSESTESATAVPSTPPTTFILTAASVMKDTTSWENRSSKDPTKSQILVVHSLATPPISTHTKTLSLVHQPVHL